MEFGLTSNAPYRRRNTVRLKSRRRRNFVSDEASNFSNACCHYALHGSYELDVKLNTRPLESIMKPLFSRISLVLVSATALVLGPYAHAQTPAPGETGASGKASAKPRTDASGNTSGAISNQADRPTTSGSGSVGTATSGAPGLGTMPGSGGSTSGPTSGSAGNAPKTGTSGGPGTVGSPETGVPGTGAKGGGSDTKTK